MDRRIHPRLPVHLPTDVDLKAGIRRVWSINCSQKMLLNQSSGLTRGICISQSDRRSFCFFSFGFTWGNWKNSLPFGFGFAAESSKFFLFHLNILSVWRSALQSLTQTNRGLRVCLLPSFPVL